MAFGLTQAMANRNLSLVLVMAALGLLLSAVAYRISQQEPVAQWGAHVAGGAMSDVPYYRELAIELSHGAPYYETAAKLHRARDFPLVPFYAVRLPAMGYLASALGPYGLVGAAVLLLLFGGYHWYWRDPGASVFEKALIAGIFAQGGVSLIAPQTIYLHEAWAGMLLAASLALLLRERWYPALALAAAALAIREFAALFVIWMGVFAVLACQWKRAGSVLLVLAGFSGYFAWHKFRVESLLEPGDLASQGWLGLRGAGGVIEDFALVKDMAWMPGWLVGAMLLLAFAGWIALGLSSHRTAPQAQRIDGWLPLAWFASFCLFAGLFARADNFYWLAILNPALLLGLAFVPRAMAIGMRYARKRLTNPR